MKPLVVGIARIRNAVSKNITPFGIIFLGMVGYTVLASSNKTVSSQNTPSNLEESKTLPVVKAEKVDQPLMINVTGFARPVREIALIAEVPGKVVYVSDSLKQGGYVDAGEPLLRIDPRDYQNQITIAKSEYYVAEKDLIVEQGLAARAKADWSDLGNQAANELSQRLPQLSAAQANLDAATARLTQAEINLERTVLSIPFAGRVRSKSVDIGEYVFAGASVAQVFDASKVEVPLTLSIRQASLLGFPRQYHQGVDEPDPVELSARLGNKEYTWQGLIKFASGEVDANSGTYSIIAEVDNTRGHNIPLLAGSFVSAKIPINIAEDLYKVPASAVEQGKSIYYLNDNDSVQKLEITLFDIRGDQAYIQSTELGDHSIIVDASSRPDISTSEKPAVRNIESRVSSL